MIYNNKKFFPAIRENISLVKGETRTFKMNWDDSELRYLIIKNGKTCKMKTIEYTGEDNYTGCCAGAKKHYTILELKELECY